MKHFLIYAAVLLSFGSLHANNIAVSNVQRAGFDATAKWALVEFDLSWENSWRSSVGPANWDAAWVFIKFRVGSVDRQMTASSSSTTVTVTSTAGLRVGMPVVVTSGTGSFAANTIISSITNDSQFVVSESPTSALNGATIICRRIWEHAYLDTADANHVAPSGSTIAVPNDSTGAFIYRSENGYGNFNLTDVRLRWKYGSNGLDLDSVDIQVFAIEMVYVPQGSFYVGDGTNTDIRGQLESGTSGTAFQISSEGALTLGGGGAGSLGNNNASGMFPADDFNDATSKSLPANYPKGYAAFYCMKYEMSQGQYRDFLNTLTYAQQVPRTAVVPTSSAGTGALVSNNANRNGIDIQSPGNSNLYAPAVYHCNAVPNILTGEWMACNYLNWMDGCAYMDWAGLRPMTELEYEKACRGDQAPVANEYAWGSTSITAATGISNGAAINETASNTGANCVYNSSAGPMRTGVFAGAATTRAQAGATYYGIMEMSGNLNEASVSIGSADGRAFTGLHGDGSLSANGHANPANWPGLSNDEVTGAAGSGLRGGAYIHGTNVFNPLRVSSRYEATYTTTSRSTTFGFRGVRTATQ